MDTETTGGDLARMAERLRKRHKAATPGKWRRWTGHDTVGADVSINDRSSFSCHETVIEADNYKCPRVKANLDFAIAAHNALPALMDGLDVLRAENALLRSALREIRDVSDSLFLPLADMKAMEAAL